MLTTLYWKPDHGSLGGENQGTRVLMVDFSKDNILVTLKEVLLLSQMVPPKTPKIKSEKSDSQCLRHPLLPRAEFEAKEFPAEFAKVDTNSAACMILLGLKAAKWPTKRSKRKVACMV